MQALPIHFDETNMFVQLRKRTELVSSSKNAFALMISLKAHIAFALCYKLAGMWLTNPLVLKCHMIPDHPAFTDLAANFLKI